MSERLPKRITVTKVVYYDVESIIENILDDRTSSEWVDSSGNTGGEPQSTEITLEDVIERIEELAKTDDFSCGWGHQVDISNLLFTDEEGNSL